MDLWNKAWSEVADAIRWILKHGHKHKHHKHDKITSVNFRIEPC